VISRGIKTAVTAGTVAAGLMACAESMPAFAADDQPLISIGGGVYDQTYVNPGLAFLKVSSNDKHMTTADFRAEYRFGTSLVSAIEPYAKLKPWVGAEVTGQGGLYGVGGILVDVPLGSFMFTPSFGTGLYSPGAGKVLGSVVEFRSQIELGYEFENQSRFSAAYSHISNANITQTNPGTNMISVYYHLPAAWLLGE